MALLDRLEEAYRTYDDAVRVSVVERTSTGIGYYNFDWADIRDIFEQSIAEIKRLKAALGEA